MDLQGVRPKPLRHCGIHSLWTNPLVLEMGGSHSETERLNTLRGISPLLWGSVQWKIKIRPKQASWVTRSNTNVLTQRSTGPVCTAGKSPFCRAEHPWDQAGPARCPIPPRWLCNTGIGFKECGAPVLQPVGTVWQYEYAWTLQTFLQSYPMLLHKEHSLGGRASPSSCLQNLGHPKPPPQRVL